jgi:hypothetical protein
MVRCPIFVSIDMYNDFYWKRVGRDSSRNRTLTMYGRQRRIYLRWEMREMNWHVWTLRPSDRSLYVVLSQLLRSTFVNSREVYTRSNAYPQNLDFLFDRMNMGWWSPTTQSQNFLEHLTTARYISESKTPLSLCLNIPDVTRFHDFRFQSTGFSKFLSRQLCSVRE